MSVCTDGCPAYRNKSQKGDRFIGNRAIAGTMFLAPLDSRDSRIKKAGGLATRRLFNFAICSHLDQLTS